MTSGKRQHSPTGEGEDEDTTNHQRKSRRVEERRQFLSLDIGALPNCFTTDRTTATLRRQQKRPNLISQPARRSPRLQERRGAHQQRIATGERQTRSSPRLQRAAKQQQVSLEEAKGDPTASPANLGAHKSSRLPLPPHGIIVLTRADKRRRCVGNGDESDRDAKRPRHTHTPQTETRRALDKEKFIEHWLLECSLSGESPPEDETQLPEGSDDMFRRPAPVLPSPGNSSEAPTSSSRKSEKSTASVHDTDYRESLRFRNIFIEREDPPPELMRRAHRILSRCRPSPELDDAIVQEVRNRSRKLQHEAEDVIKQQIAAPLIPAMAKIPDERLTMHTDQLWYNSVPVPLARSMVSNLLPLPKPKPDLAFGYSETAFTEDQLDTIRLLIDDQFGRSYAVPDQQTRFPFLEVEFKSQAKNGNLYIATNQAAGAGAVALNGHMELVQRSFGMENFDYDEPQYFSITMDHRMAQINIHWLRAPAEGGRHSFHVEGISDHLLRDANGIRAVSRAIKNILDYGTDARLRAICKALDAYRETVPHRELYAAQAERSRHLILESKASRHARMMDLQIERKELYPLSGDHGVQQQRRHVGKREKGILPQRQRQHRTHQSRKPGMTP
ncbi:hypothetical protein ABEF95_013366 [Exophiala dermatitidis]